jgi:hypothetical protein
MRGITGIPALRVRGDVNPLSGVRAPYYARPTLARAMHPELAPSLGQAELPSAVTGVISLAVAGVSTAFLYGVARESRTPYVRTTGYVLAALSGISGLIMAGSMLMGAAK